MAGEGVDAPGQRDDPAGAAEAVELRRTLAVGRNLPPRDQSPLHRSECLDRSPVHPTSRVGPRTRCTGDDLP